MSIIPNSRECIICGLDNPIGLKIQFEKQLAGIISANCTIPRAYQGHPGFVHGGIITALLDEASVRSFFDENDPQKILFTAKITTVFRKPVPVEVPIILTGSAKERHGRVCTAKASIHNLSGVLLAEAEATFIEPDEKTANALGLKNSSWMVDLRRHNDK
jgi:acyl-coenzyme A thioesterase PaaI-like protein